MMKRVFLALVASALLFLATGAAHAAQAPIELSSDRFVHQVDSGAAEKQLLAQMNLLTGAGGKFKATVASSYQGPGDVVSGFYVWGSCARAYNAAYANGTNPLCDLVDSAAPTTVICTLRVLTTGFVDLAGSYCNGGTTPSAVCAAATGGACRVSKVYDQSGNGRDFTQATAANQAGLSFSAINGLPAINCAAVVASFVQTSNQTLAQPFSVVSTWRLTTGGSNGAAFGAQSTTTWTGNGTSGSSQDRFSAGTSVDVSSVALNAWRGAGSVFNGASSEYNMNGTNSTGLNPGTNGFSAEGMRICRGGGVSLNGQVTEAGLVASALNSTQTGALITNMRSSTYGYNF
jgi:hypothetical protein